jgi:hypothetical protein
MSNKSQLNRFRQLTKATSDAMEPQTSTLLYAAIVPMQMVLESKIYQIWVTSYRTVCGELANGS